MTFNVGDGGHVAEHNRIAALDAIAAPFGGIYFTEDATTPIAVAGTFVKAAGETIYSSAMQHRMDNGAAHNRLRHTGPETLHFHAVCQASINFVSGTNQTAAIQVYKHSAALGTGALIAHSLAVAVAPGQNVMQITTHCDEMLANGDYLELHVANVSGTNDIVVKEGYLFAMGMRRTL